MKIIHEKLDKALLEDMPVVHFTGRIIVVISESEAEKAVNYLLSQDVIGFDTETRPSFHHGHSYKVALLQVATRDTCFLFRLTNLNDSPAVKRLLEDTTVVKVGLSWHDDLRGLAKRFTFTPGTFAELQHLVGDVGIKDLSLQKIYANLFGQKISKRQRLSNWEAQVLTDKQKEYAAIDAVACVEIYEELMRLKQEGYELIPAPVEVIPPTEVADK